MDSYHYIGSHAVYDTDDARYGTKYLEGLPEEEREEIFNTASRFGEAKFYDGHYQYLLMYEYGNKAFRVVPK